MTLQTEIEAGRTHNVGYYLSFDGIATRLATHKFSDAPWSLSGTYQIGMRLPRGSSIKLDRRQGLVKPGGFTVDVLARAAVDTYFARRGGSDDQLSSGVSASDASVTLKSGTNTYADGATVHFAKEAITLGTHTGSGTYTGCTRGANSTYARPHRADTVISDRPRVWMGRRATLTEVNLETGSETVVRAGILAKSPNEKDGMWSLQFLDLSRELNRQIAVGWETQDVLAVTYAEDEMTFEVDDARNFVAGGYVRIDHPRGVDFYKVDAVDTANRTFNVDYTGLIARSNELRLGRDFEIRPEDGRMTARQVEIIWADPASAALTVMLSDLGDGTNNATYDDLKGVSPAFTAATVDVAGKRFGAAIPASWVDVSTWEALEGLGGRQVFILEEPMRLVDFLVREVAWRLGGYVYVTQAGLISFRRYLPSVADSSLTTYDEGDLASPGVTVVDDESEVLASAIFECNYDPFTREYRRRVEALWPSTFDEYGDETTRLRLSSRSLRVGDAVNSPLFSQPIGEQEVVVALDRQFARTQDGLRKVSLAFGWQHHLSMHPGEKFKLTLPKPSDGEGGRGFTARQYEVTSVDPELDNGRSLVTAEEAPPGWLIAPACFVADYFGGTISIDLTGAEADLFDSSPGEDFPSACTIRMFDASASPPFSTSQTVTVSNVTANGFDISTPGTFTPAAGDLIILEYSANTGNTNAAGGDVRDHLFQVDASGTLGGSSDDGTKWR